MSLRRIALLVVSLALAACFPRSTVPDKDRQRIASELEGQQRWLAVALNVGPFFGDNGKLLAAPQPFDELELLQDVDGRVIEPPAAQRVIPPGTPVRVERVELPTGWMIARRVVMTPRYHPWVFLDAPGEPLPLVLVLRQDAASFDAIRADLDGVLTSTDPTPVLRALSDEQRAAVNRKALLEGMSPRAVELSWGLPWKRILDVPNRKEQWIWEGERRQAWFTDGRLVRWSSSKLSRSESAQ